jgi:hypothetical protein
MFRRGRKLQRVVGPGLRLRLLRQVPRVAVLLELAHDVIGDAEAVYIHQPCFNSRTILRARITDFESTEEFIATVEMSKQRLLIGTRRNDDEAAN